MSSLLETSQQPGGQVHGGSGGPGRGRGGEGAAGQVHLFVVEEMSSCRVEWQRMSTSTGMKARKESRRLAGSLLAMMGGE